jgi:cobalt-zinc-cadmium efflux system membrane fusion protein
MIAPSMTVLPACATFTAATDQTLRRWPSTPGALALAALLAITLAACSKPEVAAAPAEPTVAGAVVIFPGNQDPAGLRLAAVSGATDHQVLLTGRLGWDEDRTSRVFAPYAGRVDKLLVSVGQTVRRGQALASLSSADVGQAQADLHKAEADQALGRSNVARARDLVEGGVIARKDLEQAEADLAGATAEASRARARLAQYGVTGAAPGAINQSFALVAPLAGVVVERNSNPGAEVRTDVQGAPLFVISDPTALWATIDVDEAQLALVQPGQVLLLSTVAWPEREFAATVLTVGEAVDANSRTIKVRARVPNSTHQLKAEMFVRAAVIQHGSLPRVPADAVFLRGSQQVLFVRRGPGKFERREVSLRPAGPQFWSVLQGVSLGDEVVVGGGLFLNQLLDTAK